MPSKIFENRLANSGFYINHRRDGFIIKREKKDTLEKDIADIGKKKDLKQMHLLITNSNFCIIGKNMKLWERITGIKEWTNGEKMII